MNPYLTYQLTIARTDELHRQAARQRLTRRIQRPRRQWWLRRLRIGVSLWPRERVA